jgi:hypothetical protein
MRFFEIHRGGKDMTSKEVKQPTAGNAFFIEERTNFKINLLKNPNYFGTFPGLGNVVKQIEYNTTYEQLTCLGLNPGTGFEAEGTLEAIVQIKLANGYDSGPCGPGSTEWVRFYVEDGSTWTDLGATGVTVYNLPDSTFPVSYAVSINLPHVKKFCTAENVLNVRAILSWEFEPPANQPSFVPVWGNAVNARVQIAPAFFEEVPISSLIGSGLVKIDPVVESSVDLSERLPVKAVQPLSFGDLKDLYTNTKVPAHRYGFADATKLRTKSLEKVIAAASALKGLKITSTNLAIGADLAAILGAIEVPNGDTTYEQLTCAGYNPQTRTLEAVISIKSNDGYSGSLCTAGSYEYVSFFAFFGGVWTALGAAQVNVHDLNSVTPGNPVNYAVVRVSNLTSEVCESLTSIPLRAILSWQIMPSGPDFIPFWGNVFNTYVQPQISAGIQGEHAQLLRVNDVGIIGIQYSVNPQLMGDYLANPTGVFGDCNDADNSPFGGVIAIECDFNPKPSSTFDPITGTVLPGTHPIIYQAFITPPAGPRFQLTNQFGIGVFPTNPPISDPEVVITQQASAPYGPVNGGVATAAYYTYYESADGQVVNPRVAASFLAGGQAEGNYTVEIDGFAWDGLMYQPMAPQSKTFYVYNGYVPGGNAPEDTLSLTSAADCGNIAVGDIITGQYSVTDEFFGIVTVAMTPVTLGGIPIAMPTVYLSNFNDGPESVVYDGANTYGTSGTFTIYTGNYDPNKDPTNNKQPNQIPLPPCGYTIQLWAWDRALVGTLGGTNCEGHYSQEAVGFCLVAPTVG